MNNEYTSHHGPHAPTDKEVQLRRGSDSQLVKKKKMEESQSKRDGSRFTQRRGGSAE